MSDSDQLIESYLLHSDNPSEATWWAWTVVNDMALDGAEQCFDIILGLLRHATSRGQLIYIAAGPLEDILVNFGPATIERIDSEVATNCRLLYALWFVCLDEGSQTANHVQSILDHYGVEEVDRTVDLPPL